MTLTRDDPEFTRPIEDLSQLIDFFRSAEKPPAAFLIGTEHEKLGLYRDSLAPVPYAGERGIQALLEELCREQSFEVFLENQMIIGLEQQGTTITLEPGGQLELSGVPLRTLHETCQEFRTHVELMKQASERFGIVWLGLGVHPLAQVEEIPRMPRERHQLMREFLVPRGRWALHMMHATCGVQANFDFSDELDAGRKLRLSLAVSPIVTALYANSSLSLGEPNGFESFRAEIWRGTDPARCGFLPFVFEEDFLERGAYRAYTEWALDVPMMFLMRQGRHRSVGGSTFRQLLAESNETLTLGDWRVHLTTLFPEVRLKGVIEVRGADAVPPDLVCALPALWKGLLYAPETLETALRRFRHWSHADVDRLHAEVARHGLKAHTPDGPVGAVARELVDLAVQGLRSIDHRDAMGRDEISFLDPLYRILDAGASPGRRLLERWNGELGRRMDLLVEYARY